MITLAWWLLGWYSGPPTWKMIRGRVLIVWAQFSFLIGQRDAATPISDKPAGLAAVAAAPGGRWPPAECCPALCF
jgi:hypothetical protein